MIHLIAFLYHRYLLSVVARMDGTLLAFGHCPSQEKVFSYRQVSTFTHLDDHPLLSYSLTWQVIKAGMKQNNNFSWSTLYHRVSHNILGVLASLSRRFQGLQTSKGINHYVILSMTSFFVQQPCLCRKISVALELYISVERTSASHTLCPVACLHHR